MTDEKQHIGSLFDRIAPTYDGLNHGLSLNIDRLWRHKTVALMPPVEHVLDVAIGTADLTIAMLRAGKAQRVTGIDLSREMMRIGEEKLTPKQDAAQTGTPGAKPVNFVYANAQSMPFDDASFDGVTCAFGCRNFSDLDAGLREMYRVLRPGGQVTILEFSYPANKVIRWGYDLYFSHVLPLVGRLVSHDKTAYTYLNKSVKSFCWGEDFLRHLTQAGFQDARFETLTFGIATIYIAKK